MAEALSKGADYMRRRRAEGKAWDQQPENREGVSERKRRYRAANLEAVRERDAEYQRERYWNLSGYEYNRLLLRSRRNKALHRIAEREASREASREADPNRDAHREAVRQKAVALHEQKMREAS